MDGPETLDRMTDALHSRSDLQALRRSGRGKLVVLGLVFAAAVAAAAWSFLRPSGTGNDEELYKVIVVSAAHGRSVPLVEMGFDAAEGTFEAWERKAQDEVPDLKVHGIEAIMQLADRFGYAWVVFEAPQTIDFSPLDIEGGVPTLPPSVRFAALSAGELAFPHKMTVNPEPSAVMRGETILMLQTLFAQAQLAETLTSNEAASIEAIRLRDRLSAAIDRVERVPEAEAMAQKIVTQLDALLSDAERGQPQPRVIGETLEVNTPVPLANGQILSIAQRFTLVSRDAVRADLDPEDTERFVSGGPTTAAADRVPCPSLAGGGSSAHESAKFWFSDDGSAVLIQNLSEGLTLWTLAADAKGCDFVRAGTVPAADADMGGGPPAVAGRSGRIARAGYVGGQGVVSIAAAGSSDRTLLGMIDGVALTDPRWLGERFIVVRATPTGLSPGGLVLLDVEQPMLALAVPATLFGGATEVAEIATGGDAHAPALAVVAGEDAGRLYAWHPGPLATLFESAEASAAARNAREGLPTVILVDTNTLTATLVTQTGSPRSVVVSRDGAHVAFTAAGDGLDAGDPGDAEIALASMHPPEGGGGMKLLTLNGLRDHTPRFTVDGKHLVFRTRLEVPRTKWTITAGRIVSLETPALDGADAALPPH